MDESYFRERYEADARNKEKQSWKEYLDWAQTFYKGKRFPPVPGWNDRQKDILASLPGDKRASLQPLLEEVGRVLASEWAKDNAVRKVSTSDLQSWGKRFSDAARDPASLEAALREVKSEIERRTAG